MHFITLLAILAPVLAIHLTDSALSKVYDVMNQISTQSWENGTKAEAILEYDYPTLSIFSPTPPLPLPSPLPSGSISSVLSIASTTLQNRPPTNASAAALGGSSLLKDGAAGDPASLGVAVLLANASTSNGQVNNEGFGDAATSELTFLLYDVPKTSTGAISHRVDQAQLWSDSVYMVPPFIAYYGALTSNQTLLQTAYTQISLYRDTLKTSSGLWQHIVQGTGTTDPGLWATGNAWAAAGMTRVLATIIRSGFAGSMGSQITDLQNWAGEILGAAQGFVTPNGLLRNYINDETTFEDAAGSTLMAAAGLRLSTLNLTNAYVNLSLTLLSASSAKVNSSGFLTSVVDPDSFGSQGAQSPEGQSFVILAYSAYKQWVAQGSPGGVGSNPLGANSGALEVVQKSWLLLVSMGLMGILMVWSTL